MYGETRCTANEKATGCVRSVWNNGTTTTSYAHDQSTASHDVPTYLAGVFAPRATTEGRSEFADLRFLHATSPECLISDVSGSKLCRHTITSIVIHRIRFLAFQVHLA